MQPRPVNSKADFVRRYQVGEFGNASPTWNTIAELGKSGAYAGKFHLRNRVAGGATYYDLFYWQIMDLWLDVKQPDQWYASMMAPHHKNLIQGEVQQVDGWSRQCGLSLFYSQAPGLPMRDALAKDGRQAYGITASLLLRRCLCPNSYDWMMELLQRYSGHVVEFSTFATRWGTLPNFNTVFWEVRNY